MSNSIRVLVVDDSALMRKLISDMLAEAPGIEVVGQARDGVDALAKIETLKPDVVTLDIEMPVMNGVEALEAIMSKQPLPVVMLSSMTHDGAEITMKCLQLGAVDFIAKPSGAISMDISRVASEVVEKIRQAAMVQMNPPNRVADTRSDESFRPPIERARPTVICIGASTGGPRALGILLPKLPVSLGISIVIVQHLPEKFTEMLATRLNFESEFEVREAAEGDRLHPGVAVVAPGGKHLEFDSLGVAHLSMAPPVHSVRPSVDVTMGSLLRCYGKQMTGVLLTGMGSDGARAMKGVRDAGGLTIGEDASTCVVFGMPKAAQEMGGVERMAPLQNIARILIESTKSKSNAA